MAEMTVHELVGMFNIPCVGDPKHPIAPKGLSTRATKLYNLNGGRQNRGCLITETPHPTDEAMSLYTLVK